MQYCGHRKLEYTNGSDAGICKAACLNEVQWQGSGADLLIECGQVGRGSCGVRGTNVDPHDQVAVAEVGRLAGGDGLVWGGSETVSKTVQGLDLQHGASLPSFELIVCI